MHRASEIAESVIICGCYFLNYLRLVYPFIMKTKIWKFEIEINFFRLEIEQLKLFLFYKVLDGKLLISSKS